MVKKIAFLLDATGEYYGGATNTIIYQAVLMSNITSVIVIIPINDRGIYCKKSEELCKKYGLKYSFLNYTTSFSIRSIDLIAAYNDMEQLEQFVINNDISLLHCSQINITAEMVARKIKIPLIMNIYSIENWELEMLPHKIFPCFICSDSEMWCSLWKKYLHNITICVRAFSQNNVVPKGYSKEIVIGIVGTVCDYKNQLSAIKSIERLEKVKLLIVGDDTSYYAQICKEYVKDKKLENKVIFIGFCTNMEMIWKQIDVLLCVSMRESFPASIVEAMAANIPIISTPVAGIPEVLTNENAYLINGYDVDKIEESIRKYVNDYQKRLVAKIRIKEQETYINYFSKEAVTKQLIAMYERVIKCYDCAKHKAEEIYDEVNNIIPFREKIEQLKVPEKEKIELKKRLFYYWILQDKVKDRKCYRWTRC